MSDHQPGKTDTRRYHLCDDACVCPVDGSPLFYAHRSDQHACYDEECMHGHGMMPSEENWRVYSVLQSAIDSTSPRHRVLSRLENAMNQARTKRGLTVTTLVPPRMPEPGGVMTFDSERFFETGEDRPIMVRSWSDGEPDAPRAMRGQRILAGQIDEWSSGQSSGQVSSSHDSGTAMDL